MYLIKSLNSFYLLMNRSSSVEIKNFVKNIQDLIYPYENIIWLFVLYYIFLLTVIFIAVSIFTNYWVYIITFRIAKTFNEPTLEQLKITFSVVWGIWT